MTENEFEKINNVINESGNAESNLISILQKTQEISGYLNEDNLNFIAKKLKVKPTVVYGVATFYKQFRLNPVGKNIIKICHGTACHVNNIQEINDAIEDELKIKTGETTDDRKFTLEKVACLGCCSLAPVVMINEKVFGNLTAQSARKIIKKY